MRLRILLRATLALVAALVTSYALNVVLGDLFGIPGLVVSFAIFLAVSVALIRYHRRVSNEIVTAATMVAIGGFIVGFGSGIMTFLALRSMESFDAALQMF